MVFTYKGVVCRGELSNAERRDHKAGYKTLCSLPRLRPFSTSKGICKNACQPALSPLPHSSLSLSFCECIKCIRECNKYSGANAKIPFNGSQRGHYGNLIVLADSRDVQAPPCDTAYQRSAVCTHIHAHMHVHKSGTSRSVRNLAVGRRARTRHR